MKFSKNMEKMMDYFTTSGAFLTVKSGEEVNTMTIGWGFVGYLWGKPYFIVAVRPQRHTFKLIENANDFTVSVPFGTLKEELKICGTKSGADIDKSKVVTFKDSKSVNSPIVDGCDVYYECIIKYGDSFKENLMEKQIIDSFYKDDYHKLYFGEIIEFNEKE